MKYDNLEMLSFVDNEEEISPRNFGEHLVMNEIQGEMSPHDER
jgi:hypothetical protein